MRGKRESKKLAYKIITPIILSSFLLYPSNFYVYGATEDDVRELIGRERIDETFTIDEVNKITAEYMRAERNNLIAKMFELGESIILEDDTKKVQLMTEISFKQEDLVKEFRSGEPLDKVLKTKTELERLIHEKNSLRQDSIDMMVEFVPNKWTKDYEAVQKMLDNMGDSYDIGDVGIDLRFPVLSTRVITSPFGTRIDPIDKEVRFHSGLDFGGYLGEPVLAQWNGVVSNTYYSDIGGNVIELTHGEGLKTQYWHLDEILVEIGQEVKQYDIIGKVGSTGRSTGPHLHFQLFVDGVLTNPLYIYGQNGVNLFKEYASRNQGIFQETHEIVSKIKDKPKKLAEDELLSKGEEKGFDVPIAPKYNREPVKGEGVIEGVLPEDYKAPNPGIYYYDNEKLPHEELYEEDEEGED